MTTVVRRVGIAVATVAVATSSFVTLAGSATAAPAAKNLIVTYDAVGTSTIAKPNSTVSLGPSVLSVRLAPVGTFTAALPLPPTTSSFKVLGLVPVGKVTGKLTFAGSRGSVTTKARYYIKLSNVTAGGIPTPVGDACQTAAPVLIPLATPADQSFDITNGGTVSGTFTIGDFANCGLVTGLFNMLVPGPGNTASVTLSNGQVQN